MTSVETDPDGLPVASGADEPESAAVLTSIG
jgi:hypothetical protein